MFKAINIICIISAITLGLLGSPAFATMPDEDELGKLICHSTKYRANGGKWIDLGTQRMKVIVESNTDSFAVYLPDSTAYSRQLRYDADTDVSSSSYGAGKWDFERMRDEDNKIEFTYRNNNMMYALHNCYKNE